jgi:glycosyltransferase involved in cell wall biosynthesis
VDDGSTDGSLACAQWFAQQDARFIVLATPHQGLITALNTGLTACRGRFVARMDADDLMHRQRLARQVQALDATPQVCAVGCHVRLFPRHTLRPGRRTYERWLNSMDGSARIRQDAFVECPLAHPTFMIRRQVLVELGYRDCGWPEDYDLLLRLLQRGECLGIVPRRLLSWRDSTQRLSRTDARYALERFTACKAAFLAASFLSTTDTYRLWGYGDTGRTLRRALLMHGKTPSHIIEVHPGRLGQRIQGAVVIPPAVLPQLPACPTVVSVAGATARSLIRQAMQSMGFVELQDFVCAA